jgi:hypothetical protein
MPNEFQIKVGELMMQLENLFGDASQDDKLDKRALAVAKTHFETGLMWLAQADSGEALISGF